MNELLERLKLYEPLFGQWKVDFIATTYHDMAWVYLKDERAYEESYALMKVKTLICQEDETTQALQSLMDQYDVPYPYLDGSPYSQEEHYLIENEKGFYGMDVCLLSRVSELDTENIYPSGDNYYELAMKYMIGQERVQDEYMAFDYFYKGSVLKEIRCLCSLGYMYEVGLGCQKDLTKALECYKIAADLDDPIAQCNYAYCHYEGIGCPVDEHTAFEYFQLSASKDHPRALFYMGECYFYGRGVEMDYQKAIEYYQRAA